MVVSEAHALAFLPLSVMKAELRIPTDPADPTVGSEHDALITGQIVSAISHLHRVTEIEPADMPPALMASAVNLVRLAYDGVGGLPDDPTFEALLGPWRSFG